jgi:CRP/FNR family transcriptional regulator, anaerobic regulatory protein
MKEVTLEKLFPYAEKSFKEDLISFSQPVSLKKGTMVGYPGAVC